MKTLSAASTSALIDVALELGRANEGEPLWHRGHTSKSHTLIPSLFRKLNDAEEIFDIERRLITRFRQRSLPYWPNGYPQNDWEHLFAMQHYGIPTRLLDWTENLLVALYFAALPTVPEREVDDTPAIWKISPARWNRNAKHLDEFDDIGILTTDDEELKSYAPLDRQLVQRHKVPLAIYGTHNSARIVAQRGAFSVAGKSLEPMEQFAVPEVDALWKIDLLYPRDVMRNDLEVLGFAESMVFPDMVGLSKEITASEGLR